MRSLFGRPEAPTPPPNDAEEAKETRKVITEQKKESDKVLSYVDSVLKEKDRLLAEAINQTGNALRTKSLRAGRRRR